MNKGTKNERRAHKILQRAGYIAYRPATVRFGENDVFGLFDVLAVDPSNGHEKWLQCKTNDPDGKGSWFSKVHLFSRETRDLELWSRYDRQGWTVDRYDEMGSSDGRINGPYRRVYDERAEYDGSTIRSSDVSIGDYLTDFLVRDRPAAGGAGR